jgi:hypothetical protein
MSLSLQPVLCIKYSRIAFNRDSNCYLYFPACRELSELASEISALNNENDALDAELQMRKKQFSLFFHSIG